jgi:hypothetical protein
VETAGTPARRDFQRFGRAHRIPLAFGDNRDHVFLAYRAPEYAIDDSSTASPQPAFGSCITRAHSVPRLSCRSMHEFP